MALIEDTETGLAHLCLKLAHGHSGRRGKVQRLPLKVE
jgi:hypothetical protein